MRHNSFALGCRWVLRALGRNPLIRSSDRLEALAVLMVFVVALLAVPFATQAGNDTYNARMQLIDEQLSTRHSIEAVVVSVGTSTSASAVAPGRYNGAGPVRAEWREGEQIRTEAVPNPTAVKKGEPVTVWLDNTGKVVPAPDTPDVANSVAAGRTWTVWLGTMVLTIAVAFASRRALDRMRATSWEREIQLLSRNDDGWANRHT